MVNEEDYRRAGVPTSLLSCSYKSWQKVQLRMVLDHYEQEHRLRASKLNLMSALHALTQRIVLSKYKKLRISKSRSRCETFHYLIRDTTPTQGCLVCFENLDASNTPRRRVTSSCNHEPNVCLTCLCQSIIAQFTGKLWDQIDCPTCSARLGYEGHQDICGLGGL